MTSMNKFIIFSRVLDCILVWYNHTPLLRCILRFFIFCNGVAPNALFPCFGWYTSIIQSYPLIMCILRFSIICNCVAPNALFPCFGWYTSTVQSYHPFPVYFVFFYFLQRRCTKCRFPVFWMVYQYSTIIPTFSCVICVYLFSATALHQMPFSRFLDCILVWYNHTPLLMFI
jgi:hypothetical protein